MVNFAHVVRFLCRYSCKILYIFNTMFWLDFDQRHRSFGFVNIVSHIIILTEILTKLSTVVGINHYVGQDFRI